MTKIKKFGLTVLLCLALLACVLLAVSCDNSENEQSNYTIASAYGKAKELGFNGTLEDFISAVKGDNGSDGVGIKSVELSDDGELVITDTDGKVIFCHKLPLCSHDYSESEVGLLPTCASAGYNYQTCAKCGDVKYQVTPALGHNWGKGTVILQADCSNNGLIVYSCLNCDLTKSEVVTATGEHRYENGVCVYCDASRAKILDEYYNGNYGYKYLSKMENGANMRALYDAIHSRVLRFHNDSQLDAEINDGKYVLLTVTCADYGLTLDQAVAVWKTYLDDKPLYYWLSKTAPVVDTGTIAICVDEDYAQGSVRSQYNEQLYKTISEYDDIAKDESAYSVAFAFHDKIISSIDYAYDNANVPTDALWAHSIIGVFEGKGAVCEGYSRAFQLLLNTRSIQNVVVTGTSQRQNHAWNLVELDDGKWYWYDLTWDDTPNIYWGISQNYLCATDAEFLKNHEFDLPTNSGVHFLYALPDRATQAYSGDEIKYLDEFTENVSTYVVIGYAIVSLSESIAAGDYVIPETVTYRERVFTVASIAVFKNGKPTVAADIFDNFMYRVKSITIPSTVVYICDNPFTLYTLQNIYVDENNPKYRSVDGVLFTKDLVTLIQYPAGNRRSEYTIPEQTYYIADHAFSISRNIQNLTIGKNVALVGVANWGWGYPNIVEDLHNVIGNGWAFIMSGLSNTAQVVVDEENPYYKVVDNLLLDISETTLYACAPCAQTVVIPPTVTSIEIDAFWNAVSLVSVTFTSPVQQLGRSLFANCLNLEQVTLAEGMETISRSMFTCCHALKSITIPSSVKIIKENAFWGCSSLEQIIMLGSVQTIEEGAFDCEALKIIVMPNSVTFIGANVIGKDDDLYAIDAKNLYIYFEGTSDEWNAISKTNAFSDKQLDEINLYFYSDVKPTEQGNYWHYVDGEITKW